MRDVALTRNPLLQESYIRRERAYRTRVEELENGLIVRSLYELVLRGDMERANGSSLL